jgi:twinkle protein
MSDIVAIKRRLADRVQDVAAMLLPGGRREALEWRAGSIGGEKGQSLGVHIGAGKAGVWTDFSTGQGGDLIDLWMAVKGLALPQALDDIRAYLGMSNPDPYRDPRPSYTRPPKPKCAAPKARVLDYLQEDRSISRAVIDKYRVGEDGSRIVFPFLLPDGTLAMAKTRDASEGSKPIPTAANCEAILFGWQAIGENERSIVITEGEIDALSMAVYDFPAMSVPFGGGGKGKQNWIENEFDRLARFEHIFIATDMDEQGDLAAAEISARLGRHRCYRVQLPRKDANACLVDGVTQAEIAQCLAKAQNMDPEGLRRAAYFEQRMAEMFWPSHEERIGYSMPYAGVSGKLLFRPAEVTLWSGSTGSGKSQLISDSVPRWIQEGSRVCVASFEMKPEWTLKRMVKQAGGVDRPTLAYLKEIIAFLDTGLLLYEKVGKSSISALLDIFDYARAKYGCDQFVIDSLMRLGIDADDYNAQEQGVFKMVDWAIANNVHLHLVAHSRKGSQERTVPEAEDIKGAMEIGANAFNIVTIWRNRKIEDVGGDPSNRPDMTEEPGVTMNVAKQRNGDFEGKVKLFFNTKTYQYFSQSDSRRFPRSYVEHSLGEAQSA